jgi:hypothetical protein
MDARSQAIVNNFSLDACHAFAAYVPSGTSILDKCCWFEFLFVDYILSFFPSYGSGPEWSIGDNVEANVDAGLVSSKVACLIESLLEYRLACYASSLSLGHMSNVILYIIVFFIL